MLFRSSTLILQAGDSAEAYEATLKRVSEACAASADCALGSDTLTLFRQQVAALRVAPQPTTIDGEAAELTSGWYMAAVADGVASGWAGLTDAMGQLRDGDASVMLQAGYDAMGRLADGRYSNANEMYNVVLCVDYAGRMSEANALALYEEA